MRRAKGIIIGAVAGFVAAVIFAAFIFVVAINTPPTPPMEMGAGPADAPYLAWAILVLYGPPATLLGAVIGGVWAWLRRRNAGR